ncbi:hypothetical protein [Clostridium perfringens]|uniref:hypothetical protein n=1 Tax=Clostridium perfringens TaxID=1502 RepID=UPI003BAD0E34
MISIKLTVNILVCIIVISCNFVLTYKSHIDDELIKQEKDEKLEAALLYSNRYLRISYLIFSILIGLLSIILIYIKLNYILIIGELFCIYYSFNKLLSLLRLRTTATDSEKNLILYWTFNIIDEAEDKNLSESDTFKLLSTKMNLLSKEKNIKVVKINKVLEELVKDVEMKM